MLTATALLFNCSLGTVPVTTGPSLYSKCKEEPQMPHLSGDPDVDRPDRHLGECDGISVSE